MFYSLETGPSAQLVHADKGACPNSSHLPIARIGEYLEKLGQAVSVGGIGQSIFGSRAIIWFSHLPMFGPYSSQPFLCIYLSKCLLNITYFHRKSRPMRLVQNGRWKISHDITEWYSRNNGAEWPRSASISNDLQLARENYFTRWVKSNMQINFDKLHLCKEETFNLKFQKWYS